MKQILAALLLMIFSATLSAQSYDPSKIGRKATNLYTKALESARDGNFKEGIKLLSDALKSEPRFADAYLSIAGMYGEMKDYNAAVLNYEKASAIDSVYFQDYSLPYSINLAGKGDFEKALTAIRKFLAIPNLSESSIRAGRYRERSYQFAIDYAKQNDTAYLFNPVNLGEGINSEFSEYFPALTIDGNTLIYTRRVRNYNEDFFGASRENGSWSAGESLEGEINSDRNEGAQNISQDGEWLIFTGCNFPEGFGSCDLYISYRSADGWSSPENLGPVINSEAWESAPSLSADKRDLYFASNRAGGYGGSDIYVTRRLPNGRWTRPENLGPEINTSGDESCPFIHADNQTLYFTSNGHPGYGGDDLFLAKKGPKGIWSKATNLGYPINTIENEGSLVIAADGETAYYASDRSDSRGGLDLYTFKLREDIRPARTLWVQGKVYDKETNKGLPSAVELTDLSTQETLSRVQTDETGNYLITLPVGKDYAFNVNRKGYLFFSENFSLKEIQPDSTYKINIPLQPLAVDAAVVLRNIFFDVNKYELKPESTTELDKLVTLLKENPTIKIEISGHTDNVGQAADNLRLSNNRAESVVKYLVTKGIEKERLSSKGFGAEQPVADNETEAGKAKNRRTELKVISR